MKCSIGRRVKNLDMFSQQFEMKLDGSKGRFKSYIGAILTLFSTFLLIGYILAKGQVWFGMIDIDVMSAKQVSYFESGETFSAAEDRFFVAAALTEYNNDPEPIEDPSYGKFVFEHFRWGNSDDGDIGSGRQPIETRPCTEEELSLVEDKSSLGAFKVMSRS